MTILATRKILEAWHSTLLEALSHDHSYVQMLKYTRWELKRTQNLSPLTVHAQIFQRF